MSKPTDPCEDIWELVEFSVTEARLLRDFLGYLQTWPDSWETKQARIQKWHDEIGLQLGNPEIIEQTRTIIQKLRDAPPELRKIALQQVLAATYSTYFPPAS